MAKIPQPAKKSYFFDKGYVDMRNTIKGAWSRNGESIGNYAENLQDLGNISSLPIKIFMAVINILAIIAIIICGSIITAFITTINVAVLLLFMAIVYIGFSVIWLVDRIYLARKKIFTACHECKEKSLIPTYICHKCGAKHTSLTPGVYGILHRKCNCGEILPVTFFNGRKELEAECPHCGHPLTDKESRPLCIPIVGGRSVGKTAFITAFSREFIENIAPAKGIKIDHYNSAKNDIYKDIIQDYNMGSTRMTARPHDVTQASAVSFSFFAKHPSFSPDRLIHIYDIAGEVFTDNNENEIQKQYEYCQGIVLMIDPFAIPSIRYKYEELIEPEDIAGIGKADINEVINAFLNKLREVTGLSDNKMATVPLAIVIGKTDCAGLEQDIGDIAVNKLMRAEPDKYTDYYDTQDYLCRKFLKENDMESFLSNITIQFKTNRFFACSAIGHTRDKGKYEPKGVLPPMQWLFGLADHKMGQVWNDITFSKKSVSHGEQ
jgi:hypothetical protein